MGFEVDRLEVHISSEAEKALKNLSAVSKQLSVIGSQISAINGTGINIGGGGSSKTKNGFGVLLSNMGTAKKSATSLAAAFGRFYATYFLVIRGIKALSKSIGGSMEYVETFNYLDVTLKKLGKDTAEMNGEIGEESARRYYESYRDTLNTLTKKMSGYDIGANGELTQTLDKNLGLNPSQLMQFQARISAITNSAGLLGEVSVNTSKALSMLSADISSLTNQEVKDVMTNLSSGLIGQARALYKYGIDITNTKLQEYATALAIQKKVSAMTQAEKMQLRMLAILDQSKVAWGDQANTINSVANQYRIFKQQVSNLGRVLGNLFLPIVQKVLPYVNALVIVMQRLFQTLGFQLWGKNWLKDLMDGISGGSLDASDNLDDVSDSMDDAAASAKKLSKAVLGLDELNILQDSDSGSGSGSSFDISGDIANSLEEYESVWDKAFQNQENAVKDWAEKISAWFEKAWKAIEPFREAVKKLWDEGLSKLANFTWTALKDFYENFLVPIGKWAFGTEDKGLTRLVNIINEQLNKIPWEEINKNLKEFWIAIEPYAENFGEGLIDFFEDLSGVSVDIIKGLFGDNGILPKLTKWLNDNDPKRARDWGYSLGELWLGLLGITALSKVTKWFKESALIKFLINFGTEVKAFFAIFEGLSFGAIIAELANMFGIFASFNPGLMGELGLQIDRWLEGTIFDTNTWTGLAKDIDNAIMGVLNAFGKALGDVAVALGTIISSTFSWTNTLSLFEEAKKNFNKVFNEEWVDFKTFGKNIICGIGDGLMAAVGLIVEPIANFFNVFIQALCDVFGIHGPAESMKPYGEFIFLGIMEGFSNLFDTFGEKAQVFLDEYVKPWFTVEKWSEVFGSIGVSLSTVWANTALKWSTDISKWWNTNVAPWFTLEKWKTLLSHIEPAFSSAFKAAGNTAIEWLNKVVEGVEDMVNLAIKGLNKLIDAANAIPGVHISHISEIALDRIPMFYNGGFIPEGSSLFAAGEYGRPEILGTINGRNAVAGGDEITGIATAVYETGNNEMSLMNTMIGLLTEIASKDASLNIDGRELVNAIDSRRARNGYSFT